MLCGTRETLHWPWWKLHLQMGLNLFNLSGACKTLHSGGEFIFQWVWMQLILSGARGILHWPSWELHLWIGFNFVYSNFTFKIWLSCSMWVKYFLNLWQSFLYLFFSCYNGYFYNEITDSLFWLLFLLFFSLSVFYPIGVKLQSSEPPFDVEKYHLSYWMAV